MAFADTYHFKKSVSIQELEAILEEDSENDEIDAVYIPPPVDTLLTDEEDLNDDLMMEEQIISDVAGTFEIHKRQSPNDRQNPTESTSVVSTSATKKKLKWKPQGTQQQSVPSWTRTQLQYSSSPSTTELTTQEEIKRKISGKSPLEVFSLFFDDVCNTIVQYSIKYAQDNDRHDFNFTLAQLRHFIGILILTGYHTLPATDMYWSKDLDKGVDLVRKCMSRNTFRAIKRNLHLSEYNILDKNDKFSKLRPTFTTLNQRFLQFGIFTHNLSIDEQMVPYFGRQSAKMFIKGKPVRIGFKIWCLCSSDGYLYQFIPYGGASAERQPDYPLGTKVVLDLLSVLPKPSECRVFFDNFFSSYNLFRVLKDRGIYFTCTVRENTLPDCPLQSSKELAKEARGEFDYTYDDEAEVTVVRWNDNSVVTVATNNGTIQPIVNVKRYNRKQRKETLLPQPNVLSDYNQHVGGVDLLDNAVAKYRIRVRGKKWWWPLFTNLVDCTIVNAWKIYNIANSSKISQLEFRSYLVLSLLQSETRPTTVEEKEQIEDLEESAAFMWGRPSRSSLPDEVRYDQTGHNIVRQEDGKRRRCRLCRTNSVYMCEKCRVHLHTGCFTMFHTKS